MQAVQFFAVFFFADGIGSVRGGFFCRGGRGVSGQVVMTGFFVRGGLRKCRPRSFLRCFFLQKILWLVFW